MTTYFSSAFNLNCFYFCVCCVVVATNLFAACEFNWAGGNDKIYVFTVNRIVQWTRRNELGLNKSLQLVCIVWSGVSQLPLDDTS